MTNVTFFYLLIPILALVLLAVNFIFATHTPYQEKNSTFECGFHSFLGQNRMQFNISFYIFGLLFLLFDLEILLTYPYPVSAQFNSLYGLCVILIFFLVLALGFAFELGKNALKIDSRQYDYKLLVYNNNNNKFLISGFFNISDEKKKDIGQSIFSWFIVLCTFSFVFKMFITNLSSIENSIYLIFIVSILANILRLNLKYGLKGLNTNITFVFYTKEFVYSTIFQAIVVLLSLYPLFSFLVYFNLLPAILLEMFCEADTLCETFVPKEWEDVVNRVENVLNDPENRMNKQLTAAKTFDNVLKDMDRRTIREQRSMLSTTEQSKNNVKDMKSTERSFNKLLDKNWSDFSKQRSVLKRSALRVRDKFATLPDDHELKKDYLDKIDNQLYRIRELGKDFNYKSCRQRK